MKQLAGLLLSLFLVLMCWGGFENLAIATPLDSTLGITAPVLAEQYRNAVDDKLSTEFGKKVDLNNTNVRAFMKYPGMYPTLARILVKNSPYDSVEEILDLPGLSERQTDILKSYLDEFTVTPPNDALVEGDDRINNGIYR